MSNKNEFVGSATVTLHTNFANRTVLGRNESSGKPPIPSVFQFNAAASLVVKSCRTDDPFAWFALVDIEESQEQISKILSIYDQKLDEILKIDDRIKLEETTSKKPQTHTINLSGYGFTMVELICDYDNVCCKCFNAVHRNRISHDEGFKIMEAGSLAMRRGILAGQRYVFTGVTRQDLKQGNQKAENAVEKLITRGFIDQRKFNDTQDMCQFFASYEPETKFGPSVIKISENNSKASALESKTPNLTKKEKVDMLAHLKEVNG